MRVMEFGMATKESGPEGLSIDMKSNAQADFTFGGEAPAGSPADWEKNSGGAK